MRPTVNVRAGHVLRLKRATVVGVDGVADLAAPAGRQLVALVLGVSDPGVPFDVEPMLRALGYVPEPEPAAPADGYLAVEHDTIAEHGEEEANEH